MTGLRAEVTRRAGWSRLIEWHLGSTYLVLVRHASGGWVVVDERERESLLAGPYSKVNKARVAAERVLLKNGGRYGKGVAP